MRSFSRILRSPSSIFFSCAGARMGAQGRDRARLRARARAGAGARARARAGARAWARVWALLLVEVCDEQRPQAVEGLRVGDHLLERLGAHLVGDLLQRRPAVLLRAAQELGVLLVEG